MRRTSAALLATLWAMIGCPRASGSLQPPPPGGHHVLFIGNSLTYTNDLPGTLSALAASVGDTIRSASVAKPDYALIDHLNDGDAVRAIGLGGWEYVVLQQGPSTLPISRDSLVLWTRAFDPFIRAAGARPALFMSWPDVTRRTFFDACRDSYQQAAQAVNGVFMPAGMAWVNAWAADSTLPLYGPDGYHPSVLGTYLAALEIYERVTGHDARNLPATAIVAAGALNLSTATVRLLQVAAHQANSQYSAR